MIGQGRFRQKHRGVCLLVILFGVALISGGLISPGLAQESVILDWVRFYPGGTTAGMALDGEGNILVTGTSDGTGTDYATIKYNPLGEEVWVSRYNRRKITGSWDRAQAIAVSSQGNVFVTGETRGAKTAEGWDTVAIDTIKYNASGDQVWLSRYNGPYDFSSPTAIAVDDQENIYVVGYTSCLGSGWDYVTIKYNSEGQKLWARRYNGPANEMDIAVKVVVDRDYNVYVTGNSRGIGSDRDIATIKYNSDGQRLWVRRYNGPGNGYDSGNCMALDAQGNVYVAGISEGSGTDSDAIVIKYSPTGQHLWRRRYNGPGNGYDDVRGMAVDSQGNVCLTGYCAGIITSYEYFTIKYSPTGQRMWRRNYRGLAPLVKWTHNKSSAIALDDLDNVYVTGTSTGATYTDMVTIKYSPIGEMIWEYRHEGTEDTLDGSGAIAVDRDYNVYVSGGRRTDLGGSFAYDYLTIKYSQIFP